MNEEFWGMPMNAAAHGGQIDTMMWWVHILMALLFVGWGAFFVVTLFRFRAGKNKSADYAGVKSKTSKYLEITVAAFEAFLLFAFSIPLWNERVNEWPNESDAVVIRVVAEQFAWNIHYPGADGVFGETGLDNFNQETNPLGLNRDGAGADDITTINQLHLPVGKPVIIHLYSKDVIHSFGVPQLRVKQDAIPGSMIPLWFEAVKTGNFEIACAQLCGLGHYRMKGFVTVESPEDYQAWLDEQAAALAEAGDEEAW